MASKVLSDEEIQRRLAETQAWEWKREEKLIERNFVFKDFREAMAFLVQVAFEAEEADHHPDISLSYKRLKLRLTTHSEKGLTEKDFNLAKKINEVLGAR